MSKTKKTWCAVGRTWGPYRFETYNEAYSFVREIPDSAIDYDGEVAIMHKVDDEWKEYQRF